MIYVVGQTDYFISGSHYKFFETNTESLFNTEKQDIEKLLSEHRLSIANLRLNSGEIKEKQWCNKIHHSVNEKSAGAKYVMICEIDTKSYKLAKFNEEIKYADKEELLNLINHNKVDSCIIDRGR